MATDVSLVSMESEENTCLSSTPLSKRKRECEIDDLSSTSKKQCSKIMKQEKKLPKNELALTTGSHELAKHKGSKHQPDKWSIYPERSILDIIMATDVSLVSMESEENTCLSSTPLSKRKGECEIDDLSSTSKKQCSKIMKQEKKMKRKHQPRFEDDGHRLRSQSISKQRMDHSQRKDVPLSTVFRRLMSDITNNNVSSRFKTQVSVSNPTNKRGIIRGSCSSHVTFQRENTPNTKIPVTSTSHTTFDSGISNTSYIEHDCSIDDPENEEEEQPSTRNENDSKEENEVKPQGWRTAHIRKKQEWQNKLKYLRIGRKEVVEDKDKAEDSTMLAPFYDQNSLILKAQEQEAKASDVGNLIQVLNAVDVNSIPRASVVKQLAIAIEAGKMAKTMKEFAASSGSSSPGRDRGGLSLSAVKSMVLGEKEDKIGFDSRDEEKLVSLINAMFNVDGNFLVRMIVSDLESPTNRASFAKDLHVAPPSSFVVKLAEVIGSFTTPSRMALFWCRVVDELRRFWNEKKHIPWIPLDENPDLKSCLLHQWLQVINCCLGRKARCIAASEALDAVMRQASPANEKSDISEAMGSPVSLLYAKSNTGELILRLGIHHQVENLTMLETGEPVYAPITQEGPLLTEDLIKETEELVLRTGSMGAGCSQLLSDMQAFKAANPGCILEDFVRWHSPPDWTGNDTSSGDDSSPLRGQLSIRMQKEGNLWRELWETAKPLPAVKQTPLYDEDFAVEGILNSLEDIPPVDFFGQLFVSLVALGFVMAEPVVATNDDLSKLFFECKDYVVATCQGDAWTDKLDDLCQVYETVETMLVRPEKVLRSMKQTEESPSGGNETKRRFRRLSFIFRGKEGNKNRVPSETEQKSTEPSPRQSFSSLFDGKSSLFAKKPPRPAENGTLV
ncbi:unnamed protein product [Brassica napus]|uniref:(rape) hypothetical protein n=2 Tax=Brassica napus TaxID=3708 RepID=A0A816J1I8_BRANA|nr:unnamed protein product [Brassica napus]